MKVKPIIINNVEIQEDVILLQSYMYDRKVYYANPESFRVHTSLPMTEDNAVDDDTMQKILSSTKDLFKQKETELNSIGTVIIKLGIAQDIKK